MQITTDQLAPTKLKLTITADQAELDTIKQHVLKNLAKNVKVQGFRAGKAPAHLVEKNTDPAVLQSEFLDHAINDLYVGLVEQQNLRPVAQPQINVTKFVPFTTLEFSAEVEVVGKIVLADYKKIKLTKAAVSVAAKDIDEVLANLQTRAAVKEPVKRAAKNGDEVVIDFTGTDAKTKEPIDGADGSDYPLLLGSNSFIPGFEEELIGLKADAKKSFDITFPKDYGAAELQNRKVTFAVTVKQVQELVKAKLDDAFAATVGPFKTVA
jgi:trigger factor